jgi:AcrR family transcriptional regulator
MKEGRLDRRVRYTRMVLRESLLELLKDKPLTEITLSELCRKADINRNTFYAHYASVRELFSAIEEELFKEVEESVERSLRFESTLSLVTEICQSIQRNVALCRVLFSRHGDSAFLQRIMYLARDKSIALWKRAATKKDAVQMDWLYTYFANGCVAVIQGWVQSGAAESPEEIAHFIDAVSRRGLKAFVR